ncbi:dihydrolipoamide acetyltransferase family protein [Brevibacillus invocatus]|uniref:dihydrolipoamide acetyltransferase family protein n=1 Tax=Brevibacillus invocatus TaxID=173959 RepID=UPI00203E78FB|nr:dihydrolipoamide acetyltransferase family protein [Brevibacillus invocatus]MCM3080670.1 2-oxo acid dehydrogenase subunit E2 [Brevibacillus invocatus]MCM3431251.1 2-oxo acid dehydrogenase subunit E2 [Brevibacillus invocatus]
MVNFRLPDVGEGMHEGEILRILVKSGDFVEQDQPIVEVQTDKVHAELSAPISGIVTEIYCEEGELVQVGERLLTIDDQHSTPENIRPSTQSDEGQKKESAHTIHTSYRALATPYVRQLAREKNVDLDQIQGTGPAGRVTESDVKAFVNQEQGATKAVKSTNYPDLSSSLPEISEKISTKREERIALKGMRKKIAEQMMKSVTNIPHVTSYDEVEMDEIRNARNRMKAYADKRGVKLTFLPFFIKALVIALKEFPIFNASLDDAKQEIVLKYDYHIGIATDTPEGLIVPVIKHADRKSLFQLAEEISHLAEMARDGKLKLDQITGGTFTLSNVGPIGSLHATPIINHPEVAIISLHKMEKRWVVREDQGVIRWMMNMSLSFDHRLIDGVTAVKFMNRIKELLEDPHVLFAEMM